LPYDGELGDALVLPTAFAPSAIEELGACPLRALFRRLLRAEALESPGADELERNESGSFVHRALDALYRELFERGALGAGRTPAAALAEARRLLPDALARAAESQRTRVRERHPTAWAAFERTIGAALLDFVERDLALLLPGGVESLATESEIRAELPVGDSRIPIAGKLDRLARVGGLLRVGDYKTSRSFSKPLERARILRGLALQIPLYARAVAQREGAEDVVGEVLNVPLRPERDRDGERKVERVRNLAELEQFSATALAELVSLLQRGVFPITSNDAECRTCDYAVACRIAHPPSRQRVQASALVRGYTELRNAK